VEAQYAVRFLELNLSAQTVREVRLDRSLVDTYIIPHISVYSLVKKGLAETGDIIIVRSVASKLPVPARSTVFLCKVGEESIECTPLFSKNIGVMMSIAKVDFIKIREEGSATLVLDKAEVHSEVTLPHLKIGTGRVATEIAIHYTDINAKVELALAVERALTEQPQESLTSRRLNLLMSLSPITGRGRPVSREGIIVLMKRLLNLELSERALEIYRRYTGEKLGCANCSTCCLNIESETKLHVEIPQREILNVVVDNYIRSILREIDLDAYFTLISLYMYRFKYPEPATNPEIFLKRLSILYKLTRLVGLCPLYTFHFAKSSRLELDVLRDVISSAASKIVSDYVLWSLGESIVSSGSQLKLSVSSCEKFSKIIEQAPTRQVESRPVLEKLKTPTVQAALDLIEDLEKVSSIAELCSRCGIGIVEVGTPLLKKYGVEAIAKLKQATSLYNVLLLADTKTMDVGDLEARMCYNAGADIVTVMGLGEKGKIVEALYEAVKFNRAVMIDLMQVPDPLRVLEELREILETCSDWVIICLHRGISEQLLGRGISSDIDLVRAVRRELPSKIKLAVAGGVRLGEAKRLVEAGADIVIVGAALYTSRNIEETARRLVEEVRSAC